MGLLPELHATDVIFLHCPTCAFQTHFLSRLGEHFEQRHAGSAEFRLYRCPACQLVSSSLPFMREHIAVRHEAEQGSLGDISVYFTGKLYSERPEETPATSSAEREAADSGDGLRSCVFCQLRTNGGELAEHYAAVHGVANVFFDRVCEDVAPLLESKVDSGDEVRPSGLRCVLVLLCCGHSLVLVLL